MCKIKIKHSKGSYLYDLEIRLRDLLDEQEEFELRFEQDRREAITAFLTKEEMIMLRDVIQEAIEYEPEKQEEAYKIPYPQKTSNQKFADDYIQQREAASLEDRQRDEREHVYGERRKH